MLSRPDSRKWIAIAGSTTLFLIVAGVFSLTSSRTVKAATPGIYHQTNLASDLPGVAKITDPDLVNPWGISFSTGSPFWVADNVSGKSTLYSGDVAGGTFAKNPTVIVTIPNGSPTGTVFNNTASDFKVTNPVTNVVAKANFLFATQTGGIYGWNGGPTAALGASADAVYTGLAIGSVTANGATSNYLYAADFEHNKIDVYDGTFHNPPSFNGAFSDPNIPNSYSPFNIQNLGGKLYVSYAQQNHKAPDEETDRGSGFVDVYDTSGNLLQRLIKGNHLNAAWGMAMAPANFGDFSNALIVGNFGDGQLHAYDPDSGKYLGEMQDESGKTLVIDGLWGIAFGNGRSGDTNALYFAAGLDDETHGLFGSLRVPQ